MHRYTFNGNTENNILFQGTTAIGIYDDSFHDKNASSRFKMWGNLPGDEWQGGPGVESFEAEEPRLGFTAQLGGSAVSANGMNWTDYRRFQNPSDSAKVKDTLRFDAQASLYFDSRTERYTGTMRAFRPCDTCGGCPIWWQPHGGCQADVARHKDSCDAAQCNRTVRAIGASRPLPIQEAAVRRVFAGESLAIHSQTGSGKTLSFLLPLLVRLRRREPRQVLVCVPSRELAVQSLECAMALMPASAALVNGTQPARVRRMIPVVNIWI